MQPNGGSWLTFQLQTYANVVRMYSLLSAALLLLLFHWRQQGGMEKAAKGVLVAYTYVSGAQCGSASCLSCSLRNRHLQ